MPGESHNTPRGRADGDAALVAIYQLFLVQEEGAAARGASQGPRGMSNLRPYQRELAESLFADFGDKPGALLAVEMSLGKTVLTATAARWLLDCFLVRKVLIIAPLRVAQKTWPDEFAEWKHLTPLHWKTLSGKIGQKVTPKQRIAWLREFLDDPRSEVLIVNRENVAWLYNTLTEWGVTWPFEGLIYDESSRLKEGKKRTGNKNLSEFGALVKARKHMSWIVELTGTPAPNGVADLWGQISLIDLGERLGTTKTAFLNRWFNSFQVGGHFAARKYAPKPGAEEDILSRIEDITYSLKAKDYVDLPPVVPSERWVDLTATQLKAYRRFERELALEEHDIEAANRGVLTMKLLQYANGSVYRQDPNDEEAPRETIPIHDHKLFALESIVHEIGNESLLVAYSFEFDLERIKRKFPYAREATEEGVLDAWNRGEVRMLLAHPASIGHGMNLQFGGHHCCWYGLTASLELYQQFNARLPRPGQESERVFLHHILTRGTFDERLLTVLQDKDATQERITDAVKWHLSERE
ncbi:SNF2-related protein [Shimia sp.]|uniref:SNF2-related protein n=1 Tax=Shimia sp. TaxID=1954381 RepID=UPI0032972D32